MCSQTPTSDDTNTSTNTTSSLVNYTTPTFSALRDKTYFTFVVTPVFFFFFFCLIFYDNEAFADNACVLGFSFSRSYLFWFARRSFQPRRPSILGEVEEGKGEKLECGRNGVVELTNELPCLSTATNT